MSQFIITTEGHDYSLIYRRPDGSYVIDQGLYHVPNEAPYDGLFEYVDAYVKEHPEALADGPEPGPQIMDGRSEAEIRREVIRMRLHELSYVTEEILLGLATREDYADEIAEIAALHNELALLEEEGNI